MHRTSPVKLLARLDSALLRCCMGVALLGVTPAVSTGAQTPTERRQETDSALARQLRSLEDIGLAHRLAVYGQRARNPLALVTAAEILLANPTRRLTSAQADTAGAGDVVPDPRRLLAAARALAAGDDRLVAIIQPVEQRSRDVPRGSAQGPRQLYARVPSRAKREHVVEFRGGEPAVVYVSGDGDSDLDVFVYDNAGRLVGSSTGPRDECVVHWVPQRPSAFRVEVRNVGAAPNWYWMATN